MTDATSLDRLAADLLPRVCRTDPGQPGYALLSPGDLNPAELRRLLIDLGRALSRHYEARHGQPLRFLSISRFDQQATTRPHRDGGPDGSILLLGYEPSEVASRLFVIDSTRAAVSMGLTPRELLEQVNPTFGHAEALAAHSVGLAAFDPSRPQVVLINNGCLSPGDGNLGMLGLLHHAAVERPLPGRSRFIASVQMGLAPAGLSEAQVEAFVAEAAGAAV
jgi:hypothetical protein